MSIIVTTISTKEIRIALKKGQVMKEHKTPFPIVVEIFEGSIDFGVNGETHKLSKGDLITLEGNVPHDLNSTADSIVRLSLSKLDNTNRVKDLVK